MHAYTHIQAHTQVIPSLCPPPVAELGSPFSYLFTVTMDGDQALLHFRKVLFSFKCPYLVE